MKEQVKITNESTETWPAFFAVRIWSNIVQEWIVQGEYDHWEDAVKLARDFDPDFAK